MLVGNVGEAESCFTGQVAAVTRVGDGIVQSMTWRSLALFWTCIDEFLDSGYANVITSNLLCGTASLHCNTFASSILHFILRSGHESLATPDHFR